MKEKTKINEPDGKKEAKGKTRIHIDYIQMSALTIGYED